MLAPALPYLRLLAWESGFCETFQVYFQILSIFSATVLKFTLSQIETEWRNGYIGKSAKQANGVWSYLKQQTRFYSDIYIFNINMM